MKCKSPDRTKSNIFKKMLYAIQGLKTSFKNRVLWLLTIYFVINLICAIIFDYQYFVLIIMLVINFLCIIFEIINCIIKTIVDLSTYDIHPLAKEAKDMGKTVVLLWFIFSVIVNIILIINNMR